VRGENLSSSGEGVTAQSSREVPEVTSEENRTRKQQADGSQETGRDTPATETGKRVVEKSAEGGSTDMPAQEDTEGAVSQGRNKPNDSIRDWQENQPPSHLADEKTETGQVVQSKKDTDSRKTERSESATVRFESPQGEKIDDFWNSVAEAEINEKSNTVSSESGLQMNPSPYIHDRMINDAGRISYEQERKSYSAHFSNGSSAEDTVPAAVEEQTKPLLNRLASIFGKNKAVQSKTKTRVKEEPRVVEALAIQVEPIPSVTRKEEAMLELLEMQPSQEDPQELLTNETGKGQTASPLMDQQDRRIALGQLEEPPSASERETEPEKNDNDDRKDSEVAQEDVATEETKDPAVAASIESPPAAENSGREESTEQDETGQTKPVEQPKDLSPLVFIEARTSRFGALQNDDNALENEIPPLEVEVDSFYIEEHEVTNRQYKIFLDDTGYKPVPISDDPRDTRYDWDPETRTFPEGLGDYPVVNISKIDAQAYAKWAGRRLPTEIEWEAVARIGAQDAL
jgi:formylglycine-generating enzyme required for sulfatase activity